MAVDEAERAEVLQGPVGGAAPGASARTAPGSSKRGRQAPASVLRSVVELAVGAGAIMGRE